MYQPVQSSPCSYCGEETPVEQLHPTSAKTEACPECIERIDSGELEK